MKYTNWLASTAIILTLTAGCGSVRTDGAGTSVNTDDLIKDRKYQYSLARFVSSPAMETYLKEAIKKQTLDSLSGGDILTYTQTITSTGSMSGQEGRSSSDRSQAVFSSTILQESGVDEADMIKTDGRHLYMAVKSPYPYYGFMEGRGIPVTTGSTSGSSGGEDTFYQKYANKIRVMELSDSPPDTSEVAVISLSDSAIADSLYLVTGLSIDGYLIASRRINETIYIVTRYTPYIEGYLPYPVTEKEKQYNAALLDGASLSDLLPDIRINGEEKGDLVNPGNCYLPPVPEDAVATPDIITITAIDLASPQNPVPNIISSCIVGQAETVYVSPQSLYLATTRYRYVPMPLSDDTTISASNAVGMTVSYTSPEVETDLHKFSLDASQPVYNGSGVVPGHLGWEQDKKSFRMGEKDEYLRIATSLGETWDNSAQTMLTVLKESETAGDGRLVEVSRLPND